MTWDGMKRRSEDSGGESPDAVLARIDERVKSIKNDLSSHLEDFKKHKEDDTKNFAGLYKNQYIGYGVILAINFVILFFKH